VASAGPYVNHLHLGSIQITMPAPHHSIFMGQMLFLAPNQKRELKLVVLDRRYLFLDCIARTTYIDAVYCYRPTSVVCPSVTLVSSPYQDAAWVEDLGGPREPCIR